MSPAAFEALDCLCLSLLLDMKHAAADRHSWQQRGTFQLTLKKEERCDIKARCHFETNLTLTPLGGETRPALKKMTNNNNFQSLIKMIKSAEAESQFKHQLFMLFLSLLPQDRCYLRTSRAFVIEDFNPFQIGCICYWKSSSLYFRAIK